MIEPREKSEFFRQTMSLTTNEDRGMTNRRFIRKKWINNSTRKTR